MASGHDQMCEEREERRKKRKEQGLMDNCERTKSTHVNLFDELCIDGASLEGDDVSEDIQSAYQQVVKMPTPNVTSSLGQFAAAAIQSLQEKDGLTVTYPMLTLDVHSPQVHICLMFTRIIFTGLHATLALGITILISFC